MSSKSIPITSDLVNTTKYLDQSFSLKCALDKDGKITDLMLNNIILIKNSEISSDAKNKKLSESSIQILKRDLENNFKITDGDNIFEKNSKITIELIGNSTQVKSQKNPTQNSTQNTFTKIQTKISSIFSLANNNETKIKTLSNSLSQNIFNILKDFHVQTITHKTHFHNIDQLREKPDTNKTITKMLLAGLTIFMLAGTIGVGSILRHFAIAYLSKLGISGIPMPIAISLLGLGAIGNGAYIGLRIAAKKSQKAKAYLDDIHLLKGRLFLESNLNDLTNSALFILMALTFIHAPWIATFKGCLAYPTGALLIASGVYQLWESIKSSINNKQIGNYKELAISILNIACSSAIISMGLFTTIGMINSPITILSTMIAGSIMVTVNLYNLNRSRKQFNRIKNIDDKDPEKIFEFLKDQLSLSLNEVSKLKVEIDSKNKEQIIAWIKKNWGEKEAENFEKIQLAREQISQEKENEEDIKEIKKIILNIEMNRAIEAKIEAFGSIVTKDTLEKTLSTFDEYKKDPDTNKQKLIDLFATIKKETKRKFIAEFIKFSVVNLPLMFIPFIVPRFSIALYDILMAISLTSNIGINITPRYRNIPPAMIKKTLDINDAINMKKYHEYKKLLSENVDEITQKVQKIATKNEKVA